MNTIPPQRSLGGWLAISFGLILSTGIAAQSWVKVRLHRDHAIDVTGSARRRIVSDLIEWRVHALGCLRGQSTDYFSGGRRIEKRSLVWQ